MKKLLVLVAVLAMAASLPAQVDPTGIAGVVTNADNGQPIVNAQVAVHPYGRMVYTGADGSYLIPLNPGKYKVGASAQGFEPEVYPETVEVVAGQVTEGIDFALTPKTTPRIGRIAGMVVAANTGRIIMGAVVTATNGTVSRSAIQCCQTGYKIESLPAGKYWVTATAAGFLPGSFPESVLVIAGNVTPNINFALREDGTPPQQGIAGMVFGGSCGLPIEGAIVTARNKELSRSAVQTTRGYLIDSLPAGKYWVTAVAEGFEPGHYRDSVLVIAGRVTPGINFSLLPGGGQRTGGISGRVVNAVTGLPIRGAWVGVERNGSCARTDSLGFYKILNLRPGKYIVGAGACGFESAVFPETVVVVAEQITPNINFALRPVPARGGAIKGIVSDAGTGKPILRAKVMAMSGRFVKTVIQGPEGYLIGELPAGKYLVQAHAQGYEPGSYPDSVVVVEGQVTADIDFALTATVPTVGGILGMVTNAVTGDPVMHALVSARPGDIRTNTNAHGEYKLFPLRPGLYGVKVEARGFHPSPVESVEVVAGELTTKVDFALVPIAPGNGVIMGTVTDSATGAPIFHAVVMVRGLSGQGYALTDSLGNYAVSHLSAGEYKARACARGYFPALYPNPLALAANETLTGIDFVLTPAQAYQAGFGGFVIDGVSQAELGNARITAIGEYGSYETTADAEGNFVFSDLVPGDYIVEVSAGGYTEELYAEPITVTPADIAAFTTPATYPLAGVAESPRTGARVALLLAVGPNPVVGSATISYALPIADNFTLRMYDVTGKLTQEIASGYAAAGAHSVHLDARHLARGIYLVKFATSTSTTTQKIVVR